MDKPRSSLPRSLGLAFTAFCKRYGNKRMLSLRSSAPPEITLRNYIRQKAKLPSDSAHDSLEDTLKELTYIFDNAQQLKPYFTALYSKRVLFSGQAYYNCWYLSRELRKLGWKADLLNWDINESSQIYYHGHDVHFTLAPVDQMQARDTAFFLKALYEYDIFHFSNTGGICFGYIVENLLRMYFGQHSEIYLLKRLGKSITYANNGCHDGVSQTAFSQWGPESVCSICRWRDEPSVCSDEKNLAWGKFRNEVADYQCLLGGNRADYNHAPTVHESPEFYCLDKHLWHPDIAVPDAFRLPPSPEGTVWLYHAVGNKSDRTDEAGVNIKSSHVYLPLIDLFKSEGMKIELCEPEGIANLDVRFIQAQCDIFLDMLTFGWFGANAREAMMLGKPVICFIRPEWLESLRAELPDYAAELPIISATPHTVEAILRDLIANPEKRHEIGRRSRAFCEKWHASDAAAKRFDAIFTTLLKGDKQLVPLYA